MSALKPSQIANMYSYFSLSFLIPLILSYQIESESGDRQGKLILLNLEETHLSKNNYLFTQIAKFKLEHTQFEIYLRKYFVMHPNMHIIVDNISVEKGRLKIPGFYQGQSLEHNQTSLVARLTEEYFNGTFYHSDQVFFLNCKQFEIIKPTQRLTKMTKFTCEIFNDIDVQRVINELKGQRSNCGSQDSIHLHKQALVTSYFNKNFKAKRRQKRNTNAVSCVLHVMADHKFYNFVGGGSLANTVGEMVAGIMEADLIFRSTDFNGDGRGDNIGFVIGDITIFTSADSPNNKFSSDNIAVHNYLDILTEYNFDSYCMGIAFTYRDFERGIVGLAWVANSNPLGSVGGICQDRLYAGHGQYRSYNTALVTYLNYGTYIPTQKSALTVTHEFGHSFGSVHDNGNNPECAPEGVFGNYIMDPYSNTGEKPNHRKFSICSINNMYPVIVNKGDCFKTYSGPTCGNSVVEGTEECDCGTSRTCPYTDPCCTPADPPSSSTDSRCTIRRSEGKVCSPVVSPCCDSTCQVISSSSQQICRQPTECLLASYCQGVNASCPDSQEMPNGRLCHGGTKICMDGLCSTSICHLHGLQECQCESVEEDLCKVCCRYTNITDCDCLPASNYGIFAANGDVIYHHKGEVCNNYKGYCDGQVCLSDDRENIILRLKRIFEEQNLQNIAVWLNNFWYYIVIGLISVVMIGGLYKATSSRMKNVDIDVEAWRYGRLMAICNGAENQISLFKEKIRIFNEKFDSKIQDIEVNKEFQNPLMAISRLKLLFPDADLSEISKVVHASSTENIAVKMLIIQGFSMKKYHLKMKDISRLNKPKIK